MTSAFHEIRNSANDIPFDSTFPLRLWFRTASRLLHEAQTYDLENNHENATLFYWKFVILVLEKLPLHPQYSDPKLRRPLAHLLPEIKKATSRLESLRPIVNQNAVSHQSEYQTPSLPPKPDSPPRPESPQPIQPETDQPNLSKQDLEFLRRRFDHSSPALLPRSSIAYEYPSIEPSTTYPPLPQKGAPDLPPKPNLTTDSTIPNPARLENGQGLRTVIVPETLRSSFLRIASPNTNRNLETCGILCGKLRQNALWVTSLVIPEQESTSDTCATTDEESLFAHQDDNELLTLGWIHTHPTQTCFLSSIDLHTHCGYQLMLEEAIAIVLAPSKPPHESWGIFRLTDPPGKQTIMNCHLSSLFHPHDRDNLYTRASRPAGHAIEIKMDFTITDLRKRR